MTVAEYRTEGVHDCGSFTECVIPENIHTPPCPDGQWKFLGGGGGTKG